MHKQILLISTILLLALAGITRAQAMDRDSVILPYPICGWEKFDSLIIYPVIPLRAGLEGLNFYTFETDTLGNAVLIGVETEGFFYDGRHNTALLPETVVGMRSMFPKVKWVPAKLNGKAVNYILKLPIFFYIKYKNRNRAPLIIKEADEPIIEKDY